MMEFNGKSVTMPVLAPPAAKSFGENSAIRALLSNSAIHALPSPPGVRLARA